MTIGFIGLGNMGSGMAKNLLSHGYQVVGFDVDERKSAELARFGLTSAPNTEHIAQKCDVVVLCLPHPDASRMVIFDELLAAGTLPETIIETSTLSPEIVAEFARATASKGMSFLSAPMIGGKDQAAAGKIEFLVEGSEDVFKRCQHIFEAMGSQSHFMGAVPSATLAKLAFNLSRYANLAVGVETHRLLQEYQANIPAIYAFMSRQSLDNFGQVWQEDLHEMMTAGVPFRPSQVPKKDLELLASMAGMKDLDKTLIEAIRKTYLSMEQE